MIGEFTCDAVPSVGLWAGPEEKAGRGASPVHHGASVEGHEEDLAAASGAHRGEEHLHRSEME